MGKGNFFKRISGKAGLKLWNPAKNTRNYALDHPNSKAVPLIGKAAGYFTFGIGEKVAQKGFRSDMKKGNVRGVMGIKERTAMEQKTAATIAVEQARQSLPASMPASMPASINRPRRARGIRRETVVRRNTRRVTKKSQRRMPARRLRR